MKRGQMFLFYLFFSVYCCTFCNASNNEEFVELGDASSKEVWVYLSGLAEHFDSLQELQHRNELNDIGKKRQITFLALKPWHRCGYFDNKLCWPQQSLKETQETYEKIKEICQDRKIAGYIGFSNGGFFLNRLAQISSLGVPIISIGSAGYLDEKPAKNKIFLLIGKEDTYHYEAAKNFEKQARGSPLIIHLIEYEGGHFLPKQLVEDLLGQ